VNRCRIIAASIALAVLLVVSLFAPRGATVEVHVLNRLLSIGTGVVKEP